MKNIKSFTQLTESAEDAIELVILIDDKGNKIKSEGYAEEGVGIFDYNGIEYPAGIDKLGNIHASKVDDDNNIYTLNDENIIPNIKMGVVYKPTLESNGPTYGKEETTKKGLKFMPLTTDNPVITDINNENDDMNDDDNDVLYDDIKIDMEEPNPTMVLPNNVNKKMKKYKQFVKENHHQSDNNLKLNQKYRIQKGDVFIEFYISSIDEDRDEVYMNIVSPQTAHQAITLTSLLNANPIEVEDKFEKPVI